MPAKRRYSLSGLVLLALLAVFPTSANAQTQTLVTGTILDPNGLPYSNAHLQATLMASGTPRHRQHGRDRRDQDDRRRRIRPDQRRTGRYTLWSIPVSNAICIVSTGATFDAQGWLTYVQQ